MRSVPPARALLLLAVAVLLVAGADDPLNDAAAAPAAAAAMAHARANPLPRPSQSIADVATLGGLTTAVMAAFDPDGSSDQAEIEHLLKDIQRQVAARVAIDPGGDDETAAASEHPLDGSGWRLWAFWSADIPEIAGLASALMRVRASGLASVRPVHLCGMRHWEAWIFRMNDFRERLVSAARAGDQRGADAISIAWQQDVEPFNQMCRTCYRRGVPVMGDARAAAALRVDTVPTFRLISPRRRVHALDGFGSGFDLVAWVGACQRWEDEQDRREAHP